MDEQKPTILELLKEPFPSSVVSFRVGATNAKKNGGKPSKGAALAYIDARDVMKRLDDVVGFTNWQDDYIETPKGRVICRLSLRINNEWLTKSDGAGETAAEGEKGAISDALKRAAVKWGVGRYLYYLSAQWVDTDEWGVMKTVPKLPDWALPVSERAKK